MSFDEDDDNDDYDHMELRRLEMNDYLTNTKGWDSEVPIAYLSITWK